MNSDDARAGKSVSRQDLLAGLASGQVSAGEIEARGVLPIRVRVFVRLIGLLVSGQTDAFEEAALDAIEQGAIERHELMDALLELADRGILVPARAFDLAKG